MVLNKIVALPRLMISVCFATLLIVGFVRR